MLNQLSIEIDANGSPVDVPASDWFVCFVPGLQRQWWHRFAHEKHRHVFAMRMVEDGRWLLVEPWWTRMLVSVLTLDEAVKFLRWGAEGDILQVREAIPGCGNQVRGWANCAVLMAFMLGRPYRTWTPNGLYRRLIAEPGVCRVDLSQWLAQHVRVTAIREADCALEACEIGEGTSLRSALIRLGKGIVRGSISRSALGLYKFAVSEAGRFDAATNAYWECTSVRAIETVRKVLQQAQLRGEVRVDDVAIAARHFVAMLRGNLQLEVLFGLRDVPDATEIHHRVTSVVDLLLRGAPAPVRADVDRSAAA